ncbi:carbohydrate esterase [Muricauda sp. CAU 1633]|uniref:pectinesterase family protein n=1 Tax=Allomuricauda sp. CAU 1633 TaxID=2816036 RepID=UPI001A8C486D|nr:pectinesterase family protein [Muricauda sp. CAU 1633]MBO0324085.1 carbohydrate esterase [Muricauda sp. CAU 1633]
MEKSTISSIRLVFYLFGITLIVSCTSPETFENITFYPAANEQHISPDTHLKITFDTVPIIGNTGKIKVFDSATDSLVDVLDISIPAGPTERDNNPEAIYTDVPYEYVDGNFSNANTKPGTPSGTGLPPSNEYQLTIIGGFTDAFHFYPIIVHENTATIYLHHNLLEYNKDYYVLIDSTVITPTNGKFKGVYNKNTWRFSTKENAPDLDKKELVVDDKGTGDFNTLQGAIDYIPNNYKDTITIFIKNGVYEELIYFRNKSNIIIKGEDREKVIVQYANKEEFNPHPWNIKTNEWPGSFPSRRAAFAIDNCKNIQLLNLTVKNLLYGQAEGLLINGEEIIVKDANIVGSGDALQTNGTAYFENIRLDGAGDTILGRGAAFFLNCELSSNGPFMWVRNTEANHGNVFVNCRFTGLSPKGTTLGRAPINNGNSYPYTEAVLIDCALKNIAPVGWGTVGEVTENIHYWEYNSTNIEDGKPVDVSQRADFSRQLTMDKDKEIIGNYSNPAFVLGGWTPIPAK